MQNLDVADALSRLPMLVSDTTPGNLADNQVLDSTQVSHELNLCAQFLQLSVAEEKLEQYPLAYAIVKHYQDADTNVQRLLKNNKNYLLRLNSYTATKPTRLSFTTTS